MTENKNIFYISHGGGPMPLLGDPKHQAMVTTLKQLAQSIRKPSAILVISAHWEASMPTITANPKPALIYDYYGFPEAAYEIQYPNLGEPALAQAIYQSLQQAGIDCQLDQDRGFDHGMFVPLKIMYPDADIPCVQLSLVQSLDSNLHLAIGEALSKLAWNNLLVIGSGFSFHNMAAFFAPDQAASNLKNIAFDNWLTETITSNKLSEAERKKRLNNWHLAPDAKYCHPREEHLLPLHICYGLAQKPSDNSYTIKILQKQASMFSWHC
ncbi:DODA-type extradiol aromatic ring-opening family dioxygenase [Colwellia sp. MEBiC06753]